jgi:2-hydroxymuconate-semialdehyde hydrolase
MGLDDRATLVEEIKRIAAPTLLIHGREDRVIPLDVSYELFKLISAAQLHVFGRCGHWTQIERRLEFNAIADTLLRLGDPKTL